ncbi:hypothetical protein JCM14076_26580 [Methylosoma difficile]
MFKRRTAKNFRAFAYSAKGLRDGNEDNYLLIQSPDGHALAEYLKDQQIEQLPVPQWDNQKIRIAVADGMGGHQNGREAAELLVTELIKIAATGQVGRLANVVKALHSQLSKQLSGSGRNRPGSTLVVADIDCVTGLCVIANVGDSRAYLLREGRLHQLSHDHVYCEFAWRDGDLSDEQYFNARSVSNASLTQAMGFGSHGIVRAADGSRPYEYNPNLRLDIKEDGQSWQHNWDKVKTEHRDVFLLQLEDDDVLLFASDGLWSMGQDCLWHPEITTPLSNAAALEKLVNAAIEAGSSDNATLVMCAREGAIGGYNAIDGKTEQAYQYSRSVAESFRQRLLLPTLSALKSRHFKSVKLSVVLFLLLSFWAMAAWRIYHLHKENSVAAISLVTEDQKLFEDLQKSPLMEVDAQKRLLLKPKDYDLAQIAQGVPLTDQDASILKQLYGSKAGEVVRQQIAQWNGSRGFSALRDSENANWDILNTYGLKLAAGGSVPDGFSYVHQKQAVYNGRPYAFGALRTEFNDWIVAHDGKANRYQRGIAAGTSLHSQYVGRLLDCQLSVSGQTVSNCKALAQPLCPSSGLISMVDSNCNLASASAGEIRISKLSANANIELVLDAVPNPTKSNKAADQVSDVAISYHCEENCQAISKEHFAYQFKKTLSKPLQEEQDSRFSIETADGAQLTNEFGVAAPIAEKLGLLGLVGVDKNDYKRLSYLLAESRFKEGYRLTLTLDSHLQDIANKALSAGLKNVHTSMKDDPYQYVRRGALLVLDADTGDILAASSFPQPPENVAWAEKTWDKAAFYKHYEQLDPFLNRGWKGGDNNQAPGSSFKIFMALAAAEQINKTKNTPEGKRLENYFNGLGRDEFSQLTGLAKSATSMPIYRQAYFDRRLVDPDTVKPISNCCGTSPETMAQFYDKPLTAAACSTSGEIKNRLGVAEAIRDSSNVWFAQLAKLMDGEAAENHDLSDPNGKANLFLTDFMSRFSLDKSISLLPANNKFNPNQKQLWETASIFSSSQNNIPLFSNTPGSLAIRDLLQTSIGQSIQVTPLTMVQIATLAATGNGFHPNLIKQWDHDSVKPIITNRLDADFGLIHQGMAAVVQKGTAQIAFANHPDRCRIYGKTGTAQTGGQLNGLLEHNTAWFIGWREPLAKGKRLSFACMVTHTLASNTGQGGKVCAPIVADFLHQVGN